MRLTFCDRQRLYLCFQLLEKIRADSLADISIPQNFVDDRADWPAGRLDCLSCCGII
jgi:hypothetical protein